MADLCKLAERIVNYVREGGDRTDGTDEVVVVDRILREDREKLAQEMVIPEYEHWNPTWGEASKAWGIWWMSVRAQKILRGQMPDAHTIEAAECIRVDSVPDVDVEDIAHQVRDAAFKTYGVNIDPVWLERILREALEVHDD